MGNNKTLLFYAPNLSYVKRAEYKKGQNDEKITNSLENLIEKNKEAHTVIIFSFPSPNIFYTESNAVVNFRVNDGMKDLFETSLFNLITSGENLNETNYASPGEISMKAESSSFSKVCNKLYTLLSNSKYSFLDFMKWPDQYEEVIGKYLPNTAPYSTEEVKRKLKRASIWIYQKIVNSALPFDIPPDVSVKLNYEEYFSTLTLESTEGFNKLNNSGRISVVKQKRQKDKMYLVANSLV